VLVLHSNQRESVAGWRPVR